MSEERSLKDDLAGFLAEFDMVNFPAYTHDQVAVEILEWMATEYDRQLDKALNGVNL